MVKLMLSVLVRRQKQMPFVCAGEALRQNPNVMELEAINKWNGQLPQYMTKG